MPSLLGKLLSQLPPPPITDREKKEIELHNYLHHDHFESETNKQPGN